MDSISNIQSLLAPKSSGSIESGVFAAYSNEIADLLAIAAEASVPPPTTLGANVDVKA